MAENKSPENAFEQAFKTKYSETETKLSAYISKKSFDSNQIDFGEKLNFETQMKTELIGEAEWLNFLGDLLFQSNRYDAAAGNLWKKISRPDENSAAANPSFGKILMKQGKSAEAAIFFEKAITLDGENYAAKFYLADGLFKENLSPDGYVNEIPRRSKENSGTFKRRNQQNPQMSEAYKMIALISLANNDEISESIEYLQNALKIQPQNYRLEYNLAQLFLRRKDFEMARKTAIGLNKTCVEKDFRERCGVYQRFRFYRTEGKRTGGTEKKNTVLKM